MGKTESSLQRPTYLRMKVFCYHFITTLSLMCLLYVHLCMLDSMHQSAYGSQRNTQRRRMGQQAQQSSLHSLECQACRCTQLCPVFSVGFQGLEARSLCLFNKYSYLPNHLPPLKILLRKYVLCTLLPTFFTQCV